MSSWTNEETLSVQIIEIWKRRQQNDASDASFMSVCAGRPFASLRIAIVSTDRYAILQQAWLWTIRYEDAIIKVPSQWLRVVPVLAPRPPVGLITSWVRVRNEETYNDVDDPKSYLEALMNDSSWAHSLPLLLLGSYLCVDVLLYRVNDSHPISTDLDPYIRYRIWFGIMYRVL